MDLLRPLLKARADQTGGHVDAWRLRPQMTAHAYTEDQLVEQPAGLFAENSPGKGALG